MSMRLRANLALVLVALIWGSAFAAQRVIAKTGEVFIFNGLRFVLGAFALLPFIRFRKIKIDLRTLGIISAAGFILFIGAAFQQAGMKSTSAANAGFFTGLYVVFVPIIVWIGWRDRLKRRVWTAILLAALGAYLLSTAGKRLNLHPGDSFELIGSIFWGLHVVVIAKFAPQTNVMLFSMGQFLVCGICNLLVGLFFEEPALAMVQSSLWAIAYTGIISVALGYTLQVWAQRYTQATDAALILSGETVAAALFGYLFLGETLNLIQLLGCCLIILSILLAQINFKGIIQKQEAG